MSVKQYKYPRTPHIPWSPGATSDDKTLKSLDCFHGKEVVITEKMDGENTTILPDRVHARSLDSKDHPTRSWVKAMAACFQHRLSDDMRLCGENMYARHSIQYNNLPSFFLLFSVWSGDLCLDWKKTCQVAADLNLAMVPVIYKGTFTETILLRICNNRPTNTEGFVIRNTEEFLYDAFDKNVAKFVRANHVQTDEHWLNQPIVRNALQ